MLDKPGDLAGILTSFISFIKLSLEINGKVTKKIGNHQLNLENILTETAKDV